MDSTTRLKLIKKVGKKFNAKLKRNQRVRKTETSSYDRYNINHYTDASRYAEEYYGDRYRQTTGLDYDWD